MRYCYNFGVNRPLKGLASGICIITLVIGAFARAGALRSMHWTKIPSVTVVSSPGDSRLEAVREAIAFWNRPFADLGTPFRLGTVAFVTGTIPDDDIQSLGNQVCYRARTRSRCGTRTQSESSIANVWTSGGLPAGCF